VAYESYENDLKVPKVPKFPSQRSRRLRASRRLTLQILTRQLTGKMTIINPILLLTIILILLLSLLTITIPTGRCGTYADVHKCLTELHSTSDYLYSRISVCVTTVYRVYPVVLCPTLATLLYNTHSEVVAHLTLYFGLSTFHGFYFNDEY